MPGALPVWFGAPVSHYSRLYTVVVDVPADGYDAELAFWQGALGTPYTQLEAFPDFHATLLFDGKLAVMTQRLGEGTARVHLDIHTDDLDAEVARLERLGARRVRQVNHWWIMEDPAGLPFCVLPDPPGSLNDDNATRWD